MMLALRHLVRGSCAAFLLACAALSTGCAECSGYDRTTPENTITSFHRAFSCDNADEEYRCFSEHLKQSVGSLGSYSIARAYLREKDPLAVRFIANRSLDGRVHLAREAGGNRVKATIDLGADPPLVIELVNEPEYIVYHPDGRKTHGFARNVVIDALEEDKGRFRIEIVDPDLEVTSKKPGETIELFQHWVIDAFPGLDSAIAATHRGNT